MDEKNYLNIVAHYESCLGLHGDTHLGVDWPKEQDAETRYQVMLDLIKPRSASEKVTLLDFGCGAAHLQEYILKRDIANIEYAGLDLSEKFVNLAQSKFPSNKFFRLDVLEDKSSLPAFDYIVMNGVFTEKRELTFAEMFDYFRRLLVNIFANAEIGIAFNVMSKHVDWEREDLFHLPFDLLATFLKKDLTRNFIIRNDYGLYEYTTYVYR